MRNFLFIHAAIASLCFVNANETDPTVFAVVHAPNYDIQTNTIEQNNRVGIRFEKSDQVHILDNKDTGDRLLHVGIAPPNNTMYQYVVVDGDGNIIDSEPFYRVRSSNKTAPLNDFYGRERTVIDVKSNQMLPKAHFRYKNANDDYKYKSGSDRNRVHPIDEIPTFHIKTTPLDIRTLHDKVLEDVGILANITRISANNIEHADNVKIELSGQTSRLFKKLSYSVHIQKEVNNVFNGYRRFKLRSCATDPSYLREKVYYDVLSASEMPAAKSSYIRLFINEVPQGLYLIADNYKNPFLSNVFGNKDKKYKHGALYQGSMQENPLAVGKLQSGASLAYFGPNASDYIERKVNVSAYKIQELGHGVHIQNGLNTLVKFIDFIHKTEDYDHHKKKDDKALMHDWNKVFDVTLFLKHMALEVLMGHNDGYMGAAHNYMLYEDPDQKNRLVWLASDLDQTLGSTLIPRRYTVPETKFEQLDRFALLNRISTRPLTKQILEVKGFSKQFYQIFSDFHHSFYKSNSLNRYVKYLQELIEQDVEWDKELNKYRENNFRNNQTVFDDRLNEKVLQLPLGPDFYDRINKINFNTSIDGKIEDHPSITSLKDWFDETTNLLHEFVSSSEFIKNKE